MGCVQYLDPEVTTLAETTSVQNSDDYDLLFTWYRIQSTSYRTEYGRVSFSAPLTE